MIRLILICLLAVGCLAKRKGPTVFEIAEKKDLTPIAGPGASPVLQSAAAKADAEEKEHTEEIIEEKVEEPVAKAEPVDSAEQAKLDAGRRVYMSVCIKCHNKDPNIKGSIGPELIDAPLEVMKVKVETGRYPENLPPGFVPKRKTKAMLKLPNYVKDVPNIHAWIQSVKNK